MTKQLDRIEMLHSPAADAGVEHRITILTLQSIAAQGRPPKLSAEQLRQAREWKAAGLSDAEIARRLGVSHKTGARAATGGNPAVQSMMDLEGAGPVAAEAESTLDAAMTAPGSLGSSDVDDVRASVAGEGTARIATGRFGSRYAGAMLLHAFTDRVGVTDLFAQAVGAAQAGTVVPVALSGRSRSRRFDDVAVLSVTSTVFALGFASLEQAKHPDRAQVGPVARIDVLPELRTLRPRLAAIADRCDALALQRSLAKAMLEAEPNESGLYFIDDHFIPYTGALPVGKGRNTKRRHAEPGRVDTAVIDAKGRAICFRARMRRWAAVDSRVERTAGTVAFPSELHPMWTEVG